MATCHATESEPAERHLPAPLSWQSPKQAPLLPYVMRCCSSSSTRLCIGAILTFFVDELDKFRTLLLLGFYYSPCHKMSPFGTVARTIMHANHKL